MKSLIEMCARRITLDNFDDILIDFDKFFKDIEIPDYIFHLIRKSHIEIIIRLDKDFINETLFEYEFIRTATKDKKTKSLIKGKKGIIKYDTHDFIISLAPEGVYVIKYLHIIDKVYLIFLYLLDDIIYYEDSWKIKKECQVPKKEERYIASLLYNLSTDDMMSVNLNEFWIMKNIMGPIFENKVFTEKEQFLLNIISKEKY